MQSYMSIIDAIVDQEMQQHPTNIDILLPYMSAQMKKKYASNIIGREFDMWCSLSCVD